MFRHHSFRDILPKSKLATGYEDAEDEERVYICDICVKPDMYYSETEVEDHKKVAHKSILKKIVANPLGCMTCFEIAPNEDSLVKHIKTEHLFISETANKLEHPIYICDYCENVFFNKLMLEAHITKYHVKCKLVLKSMMCPVCVRKIKPRSVWVHFHNHKFHSGSLCQICAHKCRDRDALREHVKTHPRHYCCEVCGFETKKRELYEKHLLRHPTKTTSMKIAYKKYFTSNYPRKNLNRIMMGTNVGKAVRICILCRYICVDEDDMKRHIFSVHTSEEKLKDDPKKPMCTCGEEFFNKILLKHHIFRLKGDHRSADEAATKDVNVIKEINDKNKDGNKNNKKAYSISNELSSDLVMQEIPIEIDGTVGNTGLQSDCTAVEIEISMEPDVETDGVIVKNEVKVKKKDKSIVKSDQTELDWQMNLDGMDH